MSVFCLALLLASLTLTDSTYIKHFYSSCKQNPCRPQETCTDGIRLQHAYTCCHHQGNGDSICTHHHFVRNWREIIPFTFSLILILVFMVGVWCSLQYCLKKLFNTCLVVARSNKMRKFINRIRVILGKPIPREINSNEIPVILIQNLSAGERSVSPPPEYELPPAYENLAKENSAPFIKTSNM